MATVSTVATVQDAIVTQVAAGLVSAGLTSVKVAAAWPGPDSKQEMVFLGETTWVDYEVASIKAGRKHRDETFQVEFEVWVLNANSTSPGSVATCRDRALAIMAEVEDVLADSPSLGIAGVLWARVIPRTAGPVTPQSGDAGKGWFYRIGGVVEVHARLI